MDYDKILVENTVNGITFTLTKNIYCDDEGDIIEEFAHFFVEANTEHQQKYIVDDFYNFLKSKEFEGNGGIDPGDGVNETWQELKEEGCSIDCYSLCYKINENVKEDNIIILYREWLENWKKITRPVQLGKKKTIEVARKYFYERFEYWKEKGTDEREIKERVWHDFQHIFDTLEYNPYSEFRKEKMNVKALAMCRNAISEYIDGNINKDSIRWDIGML